MYPKEEFRPINIPDKPGVYLYRDRFGTVIYVGKAISLRRRMSSYFQPGRIKFADSKLRSLVNTLCFFEFHTVRSEDEALILESRLIKEYMPKFNILMRDDKRYPLLRIDLNCDFPRLELCRFNRNDGARYFGPFPHGYALKETLVFLNRYFKLRNCRAEHPDETLYKHCMYGKVGDCSAPCVGKISIADYRAQVDALLTLIENSITPLVSVIDEKMKVFAAEQKFEKAAHYRDVLNNIQAVFGRKNRNFRYAAIPSESGEEAVADLQDVLHLEKAPNHIEGFDNSHYGGKLPVSSMVCFMQGRPDRTRYRHFRTKTASEQHPDEYAAMREVLTRHFRRKRDEQQPMPDLVLVDGGLGQLHIAQSVFAELGLNPPLAALAERNEEIYIPGSSEPIVLDRHRPALRLLQAVRDEAHRFCITYNRKLRNEKMRESILDSIDGIGETRKQQLLRFFGSVRELRKATIDTIRQAAPGIGEKTAALILEKLNAVNLH